MRERGGGELCERGVGHMVEGVSFNSYPQKLTVHHQSSRNPRKTFGAENDRVKTTATIFVVSAITSVNGRHQIGDQLAISSVVDANLEPTTKATVSVIFTGLPNQSGEKNVLAFTVGLVLRNISYLTLSLKTAC